MFNFLKKNEVKKEEERKIRELDLNNNNKKKRKMRKLKPGRTVAIVSIISILLLAVLIIILSFIFKNNNKLNKVNLPVDPELARAMTYDVFEPEDENIDGTDNVKFSAFFLRDLDGDGYVEKLKGTCKELGKTDSLCFEVKVLTEGRLKNGCILIEGKNFKFQASLPKDQIVAETVYGNDVRTIHLNEIPNGTTKLFTGKIRLSNLFLKIADINNINNYSRNDNKIILTGTYVDGEGNEKEIRKEIPLTVDWYGTARAGITATLKNALNDELYVNKADNTFTIPMFIQGIERNKKLIIKSNHLEVEIPELNGYAPLEVYYSGKGVFSYDKDTRIATFDREAILDDAGLVTENAYDNIDTNGNRINEYGFYVVYPLESYWDFERDRGQDSVSITINAKTYYDCYNNPNEEFFNPYRTNIAQEEMTIIYSKPEQATTRVYCDVQQTIMKTKPLNIYRGISESEENDRYDVHWVIHLNDEEPSNEIWLRESVENGDSFTDYFLDYRRYKATLMNDICSYKGIGITYEEEGLTEDAFIKVYDEETGNLIVTFTKDGRDGTRKLEYYRSDAPLYYSESYKHIKILVSGLKSNGSIYITHIKEIDDELLTNTYSIEEFGEFVYIGSKLTAVLNNSKVLMNEDYGEYKEIESRFELDLNKTILSKESSETTTLKITPKVDNENKNSKWKNATFLVKYPSQVLDVDVFDVGVNNPGVEVLGFEKYTLGRQTFLKIYTNNIYDSEELYSIIITQKMHLNPLDSSLSLTIVAYGVNEVNNCYSDPVRDVYDLNNNQSTADLVGCAEKEVEILSADMLAIVQEASEFDDHESIIVSPQIADIEKQIVVVDNEQTTSKVSIKMKNNYGGVITDIKMIGVLPFEGNKYVISNTDMGSSFTTNITEAGITLDDSIKEYATVYYSTNEHPTQDAFLEENGWMLDEEVEDWSAIRTYLVDFGDYDLASGKTVGWNYTIKFPFDISIKEVSYNEVAAYCSLVTEYGKYKTSIEPEKLGFRITKKYDLNIEKSHKNRDVRVDGATYLAKTNISLNSLAGVTADGGMATIDDLYAEEVYEIREVISPSKYSKNEDVIKIITHIDEETGEPSVELLEGTIKGDIVARNENNQYFVDIKVEDEVKASLSIKKVDENGLAAIEKAKYRVTGKGIDKKVFKTNSEGVLTATGFAVGEEYKIEELSAPGYYSNNAFYIKFENVNGNYILKVKDSSGIFRELNTNGTVTLDDSSTEQINKIIDNQYSEEDNVPMITLTITDKKIPTYKLQINKFKKGDVLSTDNNIVSLADGATPVANAKFKIYKDSRTIGTFVTDANGIIIIDGLNIYNDEYDMDQTYILKEVSAPEGYSKIKEVSFYVEETDEGEPVGLRFVDTDGKNRNYTVNGDTINLYLEDNPAFKLIKKDEETGELLPGVKFAIYDEDNKHTPARNSKGEIIGQKETINGEEYYVVTTNERGEIVVDLPEGEYTILEVEADIKYELQEKTFGIGEGESITYGAKIELDSYSKLDVIQLGIVRKLSDGNYIVSGSQENTKVKFIRKYTPEFNLVWERTYGYVDSFGSSGYSIRQIQEASDGDVYVVLNYDDGHSGSFPVTVVKLNSVDGSIDWSTRSIRGGGFSGSGYNSFIDDVDDGTIMGFHILHESGYESSIDMGNNVVLTKRTNENFIIKYDENGTAIWAKEIPISKAMMSFTKTNDNGYIGVGYFSGTITIEGNNYTSVGENDIIAVKFNSNGDYQWIETFGGEGNDTTSGVCELANGEVMIIGTTGSTSMIAGEKELVKDSDISTQGYILRLTDYGDAIDINKQLLNTSRITFSSIKSTSDGGYITSGSCGYVAIEGHHALQSGKYIAKFNNLNELEWVQNYPFDTCDIYGEENGDILIEGYAKGVKNVDGEAYFGANEYNVYTGRLTKKVIKKGIDFLGYSLISGERREYTAALLPTPDGGYLQLLISSSGSINVDGEILQNPRGINNDCLFMIRYDANHNVVWKKPFEKGKLSYPTIINSSKGGFLLFGQLSNSGSVNGAVIYKIDDEGNIEKEKSFYDMGLRSLRDTWALMETSDGGIVLACGFQTVLNNNGMTYDAAVYQDPLFIKMDYNFNIEFLNIMRGDNFNRYYGVVETTPGKYVAMGMCYNYITSDGVIHNTNGYYDMMLVTINDLGEILDIRFIGGPNGDSPGNIIKANDGGYIVTGSAGSDFYVDGWHIAGTGFVIKYSANDEIEWVTNIEGLPIVSEGKNGYILSTRYKTYKINTKGKIIWELDIPQGTMKMLEDGTYIMSQLVYSNNKTFGPITVDTTATYNYEDSAIIRLEDYVGYPDTVELEMNNYRKQFIIKTEVEAVNGIKGGTISGGGLTKYETVKYGESNTKSIVTSPYDGYELIRLRVNGEDVPFETDNEGNYNFPTFTNITEDIHIIATYALSTNKITINKVDAVNGNPIKDAEFKIDQIEERAEPVNSDIFTQLVDTRSGFVVLDKTQEVTGVVGSAVNNGEYYFVNRASDNALIPTNGKTYQLENGGTEGIKNSRADSYVPIDLTGLSGEYAVEIDASISAGTFAYGYILVTDNTDLPNYSMNNYLHSLSGNTARRTYRSNILEGGRIYYLHLHYEKSSWADNYDDQVVFYGFKVYSAENKPSITIEDGKYVPNNVGIDSSIANSYIPIDLSDYSGKYNLIINAECYTDTEDYGYAVLRNDTTLPSLSTNNSANARIVYINGNKTAKDYSLEILGGQVYYLHIGYSKKNKTNTEGVDSYTVNSIRLELNDSDLFHGIVTTGSDGKGIIQIPYGKYKIEETKTGEGYILEDGLVIKDTSGNVVSNNGIIEFRNTSEQINEFVIENEKMGKVIVHHIDKITGNPLVEDEALEGKIGEEYETAPLADIYQYELEKDDNGERVIPDNFKGTFDSTTQDVYYYYVKQNPKLRVNHYIEGTEMGVPLKDGSVAESTTTDATEGEEYNLSPIDNSLLDDNYELVSVPYNATGTVQYPMTEVTFYYKEIQRMVTVTKISEKDSSVLENAGFRIMPESGPYIIVYPFTNNSNYDFTYEDGEYISGGKGTPNMISSCYIKIDTTNATETETITVNATASSEAGYDYGFVHLTEDITPPVYNNSNNRIIYISGNRSQTGTAELLPGKVYYLHIGYRKNGSNNRYDDRFIVNSIEFAGNNFVSNTEMTNNMGKIRWFIPTGQFLIVEEKAPEGYSPITEPITINITRDSNDINLRIGDELLQGSIIVHHYIETLDGEKTQERITSVDGEIVSDETRSGVVGTIYATSPATNVSDRYKLSESPDNASGEYIDGNIEIVYYYKEQPSTVTVHHYLEGTTTSLADDVVIDGIVGDNYTTGVGNVEEKYELVEIPANANGKMTAEAIEVTYFYRLKDSRVTVHYYKEGTSTPIVDDVIINGKVDDDYETQEASNIPSKYELVVTPDNATGTMTIEPIEVIYYYRLKESRVDVHYYLLDNEGNETTSRVLHTDGTEVQDVTFEGRVDDDYSTSEATDIMSKYTFVRSTDNTSGKMTENRITVIYYYQAKDTSVLVHHYKEGTTTSLADDVTINGKIDDAYTTIESTDVPVYYELVAEPTNKSGTMTEDQIVVIYYYKLKNYSYKVNYLEKDTNKVLRPQKAGEEKVWGTEIDSETEQISINGYRFAEADPEILTISENDNILNLYYTKRSDLSYVINYLEKGTNRELHAQKVDETVTFEDTIMAIDEIITIKGYTFDSFDKEFITITTNPDENVINLYYTIRNGLSYTVNYLDKDTNRPIQTPKTASGKTFEDVVVVQDEVITIYGYNYDSSNVDELVISDVEEENVINLYYTRREGKVTAHYYEEGTTNKVAEDNTYTGLVNDTYETEESTRIPDKYELVSEPMNKTGVYTEDDIDVIYYYRKKATKVIVHHLEDPTTNGGLYVLLTEDEELPYRVDDEYETHPSNNVPVKYEVVDTKLPSNATGTATLTPIEVTYYYKVRDGIVNIRYVDRYNNEEIASREQQTGKVDERYIVTEKTIPGYTYVSNSGNAEGTIKVDPTLVTFYYAKNVNLTTNHIDRSTGNILDSDTQTNLKQGDDYTTTSKNIRNYYLVEEPANASGTMGHEDLVLNYYYEPANSGLLEKHIDVITGEILYNQTHDIDYQAEYNIDPRTFSGYDLVEDRLPTNAHGTAGIGVTEVVYYYIRKADIIVKYIEKYSGNEIPNSDGTPSRETIIGHENDPYSTVSKTFDGYVLESIPENANGTMPAGSTTITYIYKRTSGGVTVNHIDQRTGFHFTDEARLTGYVGDDYTTEPLNLSNYDLVEMPSNATGKFKVEQQNVIYYYKQKASVTVRYVDQSGREIIDSDGSTTREVITGHVGDTYASEEKDFKGYVLVTRPNNTSGTMTEEPIEVIYTYRKLRVNLSVGKIINTINTNGVEEVINGPIGKTEIYRKEQNGQSIRVTYTIKVVNDGEVEMEAVLRDEVPSGMRMNQELNPGWRVTDNIATLETDIIQPGETREYRVILDWEEGDNIGTKTNKAEIVTTNNKYGLPETDLTDNESEADTIIAISTGGINYVFGAGALLVIMSAIGITFIRVKNKRRMEW